MEAIQTTLVSLGMAVISLLGACAIFYIRKAESRVKAETQKITDEQGRQVVDNALDDLDNLATVTVTSIEQTTAKELRQAVKDGKADKTELVKLSKQAFDDIKAAVVPATQAVITKNFGSFDDYLTKLIESKVLALKSATNA